MHRKLNLTAAFTVYFMPGRMANTVAYVCYFRYEQRVLTNLGLQNL